MGVMVPSGAVLVGKITPIQLRLGILRQAQDCQVFASFPHQGGRRVVARQFSLTKPAMKKRPPPISTLRARELRRNATEAEKRMQRLLKETFPDARFRFQVPLRHYIADFASHRLKVVIEIDGGQHNAEVDGQRTADIEAEGYRVIRFWNNDVLQNGEGCMVQLEEFLSAEP
jgi:very-short-patch-repair endonuclease